MQCGALVYVGPRKSTGGVSTTWTMICTAGSAIVIIWCSVIDSGIGYSAKIIPYK